MSGILDYDRPVWCENPAIPSTHSSQLTPRGPNVVRRDLLPTVLFMNSDLSTIPFLEAAAQQLQEQWNRRPHLGVILGTGSGGVAERLEVEAAIDYGDIPGFVQSTAVGHQGRVICGKLGSLDVIAMQGRFHRYEGWTFDQMVFPTRLMIQLGIRGLAVTNAAGGVDPRMQVGDLILLDTHIDWLSFWPGTAGFRVNEELDRPAIRGDQAYDPEWMDQAMASAQRHQIRCRPGTYIALHGPNYETRAEYRMIRRMGGDVVGMSTVPEVSIASLHQIPALAISVVTNVARPDALTETSGDAVVHAARNVETNLRVIIQESAEAFLS